MFRTMLPPRPRAALAAAAVVCLSLTGCSSGEDDRASSESAETQRVSAVGIAFHAPGGWEELDAAEVAEGSGDNSTMPEVAEGMGITPDQLQQMMASLDLMLVSGEGAHNGFLDNLNVVRIPGQMPNDAQVKLQFLQFGADVQRITHERSDLGDTTVVTYELDVAEKTVHGEALFVQVDGSPVSVTVSASERETTEQIADRVLDTLAEAS